MRPKHFVSAFAGLLTLMLCGAAQAQFFKDPAFEALLVANRFSELEKAASARLATKPDDPQAVLAQAVLALRGGNGAPETARRKAAMVQADNCVQRQPQAAVCHYALGVVTGVQAMNEGMIKAAGSVGRVKEALTQAVTLEGAWFQARSALVEFHLTVPGVMGGSSAKAKELARSAATPEQVRALEARLLIHAEQYDAALQDLSLVRPGADQALADDVAGWIYAAGIALINQGHAERARAPLERLSQERPTDANAQWAMARVHAEAGAHAEALKGYARLPGMEGSERMPIDYRTGISLQALGQREAARSAFSRFVTAGKGSKKALEDAKARLEQLGG
jgi:tetratricopeptide (TPR) repeat protein